MLLLKNSSAAIEERKKDVASYEQNQHVTDMFIYCVCNSKKKKICYNLQIIQKLVIIWKILLS